MTQDQQKNQGTQPIPYGYTALPVHYEEDTIDLRELWGVLKKRKLTVFFATALTVSTAIVYLFITTPLYETKATLEIGKELIRKTDDGTLQSKYFDNPTVLKQYLDVKYDTAGKYREKNTTNYLDKVTVPKKSKAFISLSALGASNEKSQEVLLRVIDDIMQKHKLYYQSLVAKKQNDIALLRQTKQHKETKELLALQNEKNILIDEEIKKLDANISYHKDEKLHALRTKISLYDKQIEQKQKYIKKLNDKLEMLDSQKPVFLTMLTLRIAELENTISMLQNEKIDMQTEIEKIFKQVIPELESKKRYILQQQAPVIEAKIDKLTHIELPEISSKIEHIKQSLQEPYLVMTRIVGKINMQDEPTKPKKALILIVSLISGLLLGVFVAFFRESVASPPSKKDKNTPQ